MERDGRVTTGKVTIFYLHRSIHTLTYDSEFVFDSECNI